MAQALKNQDPNFISDDDMTSMKGFNPSAQAAPSATNDPSFISDDDMQNISSQQNPGLLKQAGASIVNSLPAIGGVAGGILGTPMDAVSGPMGNVVGAGIGGYLGEAAKNAINNYINPSSVPKTPLGAVMDPIRQGFIQGDFQGAGEIASPYVQKISDAFKDLGEEKAVAATGATGKQSQGFSDDAGRQLLDRGLVKFGQSQPKIAQNVNDALQQSGQNIGDALSSLDSQGATLDQRDIVSALRSRAAQLGKDPASFGVSDGLNRLADRIESVIGTGEGDSLIPLGKAEATKRGFQSSVNYNSSPLDTSVAKEAADVYRQAVENAATDFKPEVSSTFQASKKTYGLLKPIADASERRAATTAQSPMGGLLDAATSGVGAAAGGAPGAIIAPIIRRAAASRIAPSISVGADTIGNMISGVPSQFGGLVSQVPQLFTPPATSYSTIPGKNGQ